MEGKFETSFIPKKPLGSAEGTTVATPIRTTNFFGLIGNVVFVTMLVLLAGVFGYKFYLKNQQANVTAALDTELKRFEPALVNEFSRVDARIESVKGLLNQHTALTSFFDFLGKSTVRSVKFTSFSYEVVDNKVNVKLDGIAPNYAAVALQANQFDLDTSARVITNPTFQNLNLDSSGNVAFVATFTLKPDSILYKNTVTTAAQPITNPVNASSTATTTNQ